MQIEDHIYARIIDDPALQALLTDGNGGFNVFSPVIPRGITFTKAVAFSYILSRSRFPNANSIDVQFNIFSTKHQDTIAIATALADLFHQDHGKEEEGVFVVYSQKQTETDLGLNYDDNLYQRSISYYFKVG